MKPLFKVMAILSLSFAATFILVNASGIITIDKIEHWLTSAQAVSPAYVASIILLILFLDLFIAVPTLTVTILAGHFLGPALGAASALGGMALAAIAGYWGSYIFGSQVLSHILKDAKKQVELTHAFQQHGFIMILLARAVPILPEVTACMAGMTRMHFLRFCTAWCLNSVPYVGIATYAGSISSTSNPKPAVFAAIGLTGLLWLSWLIFSKMKSQTPA